MAFNKAAMLFLAAALLAAPAGVCGAAGPSPGEPPSDNALKQSVVSRILDARAAFFADIQLDVIGGDAMLTGRVATLQDKARATALVRSVSGVQTVINEIHVGATDDVKRMAADLLVERQIRTAMHAAFGDQMPNLNWRVTNGIVYVFGQARSTWERNRALAVVRQTQGVAKVIDHLRTAANGG
jgi:osmotically-inducible protein OsmY